MPFLGYVCFQILNKTCILMINHIWLWCTILYTYGESYLVIFCGGLLSLCILQREMCFLWMKLWRQDLIQSLQPGKWLLLVSSWILLRSEIKTSITSVILNVLRFYVPCTRECIFCSEECSMNQSDPIYWWCSVFYVLVDFKSIDSS